MVKADWPTQPLDYFVLNQLEKAELQPIPAANKHTLIRRAYFDLIGLPPTPDQVREFVADQSTNAFTRVVDELLASSHYGERWGRHWLDVARYGDSNGADENHAYPHAWRYRNWVIDAFNRDLPYDKFLRDQLAGDLVEPVLADRIAATGFLAIGTKILAEKDPVKRQADIVDEQLDTIGRVFLGLSIGCARCHDHKFDPIPTRDYYAMAGIFHSTTIGDRQLFGPAYDASMAEAEKKLESIKHQISAAGTKFERLAVLDSRLEWEAEVFNRGNVVMDTNRYGKGIGIIGNRISSENFAEYNINVKRAGSHLIELRYAAQKARPGQLLVDGKVIITNALSQTSGGWNPEHQQWFVEGQVMISAGKHTLRIQSEPMMSHIDKVRLTPVNSAAEAKRILEELHRLKKQQIDATAALGKSKPMAMAVKDGRIGDAKISRLGNPHDHGDTVPRGFLTSIGAPSAVEPGKGSGRLELAGWLTAPDHPLTARVEVNRIWHWHFGRGLVASPDNFGTTGDRPDNPDLLDHLARQLMRNNWSVKALHREIMISSTYRMGTMTNPAARNGYPLRRMEAEVFRDAILQAAGTLRRSVPASGSLGIIAQNPTHVQLARNRRAYEGYPYRSVYLPVVRSHVYDLFTLLDFPNATTPVGKRANTTVPTQALMMMNSPFLMKQARQVGESVRKQKDPLNELYLRLFSRSITTAERATANEFIRTAAERGDDNHAWSLLCQTLLVSNDFLYLH